MRLLFSFLFTLISISLEQSSPSILVTYGENLFFQGSRMIIFNNKTIAVYLSGDGLTFTNFSIPFNPVVVSVYKNITDIGISDFKISRDNKLLFITISKRAKGFTIVNVTDLNNIYSITTIPLDNIDSQYPAIRLTIDQEENFAYITTIDCLIYVINITSKISPQLVYTYNASCSLFSGMKFTLLDSNSCSFLVPISGNDYKLIFLNITNKTNLILASERNVTNLKSYDIKDQAFTLLYPASILLNFCCYICWNGSLRCKNL